MHRLWKLPKGFNNSAISQGNSSQEFIIKAIFTYFFIKVYNYSERKCFQIFESLPQPQLYSLFLTDFMDQIMTMVFVEQPLALPGCNKYLKGWSSLKLNVRCWQKSGCFKGVAQGWSGTNKYTPSRLSLCWVRTREPSWNIVSHYFGKIVSVLGMLKKIVN